MTPAIMVWWDAEMRVGPLPLCSNAIDVPSFDVACGI